MKEHFRNLNLMYAALLIGQILFFLVILYLVWGKAGKNGVLNLDKNSLLLLASTIFVGVALGTRALGNTFREKALNEKQDLSGKLNTYRKSLIFRWVLVEGFNILMLIFAMMEQNQLLFLFFAAGIFVFLSFRPSATAFAMAYNLDSKEERSLR